MASTITLTGDWLANIGNRNQVTGTGNLGTYATNGIAVSAAQVGLGVIESLAIQPAGGYTFQYVASTGKVKAFYTAAVTPAGTVAAPTITVSEGAVTVVGGGVGEAIGINPDTNAGVLSKAAATNRTIPRATFLGSATTASASAPAFTGAATTAAALTEVANLAALAGVTFSFVAIGR